MARCDECVHCGFIPMVTRGSMDCDPQEYYCKAKMDDWSMAEDEDLKEFFSDEEIENGCPKFKEDEWY